MIELEDAQARVLSLIEPLGTESVPLLSALGQTLAAPLTALCDLPPFDNSAMDGYAVRAEDLATAEPDRPVALRCIGQVEAGSSLPLELGPGTCVRLFTGSPLPRGANAVAMQEDTRVEPTNPSSPLFLDAIKPWENVRFRGEDVKRGSTVLHSGTALSAAQAGLAAACGYAEVSVYRHPVVGLLATGSELREPGEPLTAGQIYESNRTSLAALVQASGGQPTIYPLVKDDLDATLTALRTAFAECDAVITSGGVSVGEKDLVKTAFQRLGGDLKFWRVAVKPGKPFACGSWKGKMLFGLPGNPVSAFVTFLLLVRPALRKLQGAREAHLSARSGVLTDRLENRGDRRHFIRVHLDSSGGVRSTGTQASHLLHSLADANGLVDVTPGAVFEAGTTVTVLVWGERI